MELKKKTRSVTIFLGEKQVYDGKFSVFVYDLDSDDEYLRQVRISSAGIRLGGWWPASAYRVVLQSAQQAVQPDAAGQISNPTSNGAG